MQSHERRAGVTKQHGFKLTGVIEIKGCFGMVCTKERLNKQEYRGVTGKEEKERGWEDNVKSKKNIVNKTTVTKSLKID